MGMTPPQTHLVPKVLEKSRAVPLLTLRACVTYKMGVNLPNIYIFEYNYTIRVNLSLEPVHNSELVGVRA